MNRLHRLLRLTLAVAMLSSTPGWAAVETLRTGDVQRVMEELFKKHVSKKKMTPELAQHAIRSYIEHFDPKHIYLLQEEVNPWLRLSSAQLNTLIAQYYASDLTAFDKLDLLFQKSIAREQKLRNALSKELDDLFLAAMRQPSKGDAASENAYSYAANLSELQQRLRERVIGYIRLQVERYDKPDVLKHKLAVLHNFDEEEHEYELPYLYLDEEGQPMSSAERENRQALRVLKAFAGSLDSHTSVLNPTEANDLRVRLEKNLRGIGILINKSGNSVLVEKVLPGSPAATQGLIAPGDRLIAVNDVSVTSMPFEELLDMLRGERAAKVHLKLERKEGLDRSKDANSYVADLEPAMITINDGRVETSYVPYQDGIIATIVLRSFYKGANGVTSENDVSRALVQLQKVGPIKGLILDLRGNPGGFLTQAVKVAGLFLTSGVVVISKYANGEERYYRDINGTADYQGPMVVLTSKTTASAAEIVSQALQDYGVALVVGDVQTYGKGTIQSQTVTADQHTPSYFKVTVGKYYTVSGKTPQKQGVKADIVVPGEFSLDYIGEQYDEEAPDPDTIVAVYTDPLADVPVNLQPWFQRYYVPALQQRQQGLQALLPNLRTQSFYRLHHSPEYKKFMTLLVQPEATVVLPKADAADWHALQHREAINIVRDMISLSAKEQPETANAR